MEMIDVLDSQGKITGEAKSRESIHTDGDWHRTIHVWFITPHGQLLIQRRSKTKINCPNMWDISVGGHVPAGEDSMRAALREVEEEMGLKLAKADLKLIGYATQQGVLNDGTYINNEYNDVYLVEKMIDPAKLKIQTSEVAEVRLIPWEEFRDWVEQEKADVVPHPDEYKLIFDYLEKNY